MVALGFVFKPMLLAKLRKKRGKKQRRWREREALGDEDSDDVVEIQIDGAPEGDLVGVLQAAPTPRRVVGVLSEAPAASAAEGPRARGGRRALVDRRHEAPGRPVDA